MSEFLTVFWDALRITAVALAIVVLPPLLIRSVVVKWEWELPEWALVIIVVGGGIFYVALLVAAVEVWWAP